MVRNLHFDWKLKKIKISIKKNFIKKMNDPALPLYKEKSDLTVIKLKLF